MLGTMVFIREFKLSTIGVFAQHALVFGGGANP